MMTADINPLSSFSHISSFFFLLLFSFPHPSPLPTPPILTPTNKKKVTTCLSKSTPRSPTFRSTRLSLSKRPLPSTNPPSPRTLQSPPPSSPSPPLATVLPRTRLITSSPTTSSLLVSPLLFSIVACWSYCHFMFSFLWLFFATIFFIVLVFCPPFCCFCSWCQRARIKR